MLRDFPFFLCVIFLCSAGCFFCVFFFVGHLCFFCFDEYAFFFGLAVIFNAGLKYECWSLRKSSKIQLLKSLRHCNWFTKCFFF